jgi:non-canonical poly(A) RNA polymerase PAPD5/7
MSEIVELNSSNGNVVVQAQSQMKEEGCRSSSLKSNRGNYYENDLDDTRNTKLWAPWAKVRKVASEQITSAGLHQEIEDFVQWISPTEEEKKMRQDIFNRIASAVHQLWPQARVEIIGSYKTELCLPTSDVDLVILGATKDSMDVGPLFQLSSLLEEKRVTWPNGAKVITTAKVPIIKFQEMKSRCYVDIAFEVNTGIENTKIVQSFLAQYPLLRPLTLVIKYYLKQNYLNDTWSGGIGSYTLVILIISYLQNHGKGKESVETDNLGELLIGFFEFYGRKFDYTEQVISVKDKCYYDKNSRKWFNEQYPDSLSVEDPHNPDIDVGLACFQIAKAKAVFEEAFLKLTDLIEQDCISYLVQSDIVSPKFVYKCRNHIKHIYGSDETKKRGGFNNNNHIFKSTSKARNTKIPRKPYKNSDNTSSTFFHKQQPPSPTKIKMDDFPALHSSSGSSPTPPLPDKIISSPWNSQDSKLIFSLTAPTPAPPPPSGCWSNKFEHVQKKNVKQLSGVPSVHN